MASMADFFNLKTNTKVSYDSELAMLLDALSKEKISFSMQPYVHPSNPDLSSGYRVRVPQFGLTYYFSNHGNTIRVVLGIHEGD